MLITGAITVLKALENGNELNLLQNVFEIVIGIRKKTLSKVSICVTYCVLQMPQTHSACLPSLFGSKFFFCSGGPDQCGLLFEHV